MLKTGLFLAAMAFATSVAAAAPLSATLQTPVTAKSEVAAGDVLWNCDGATCTAKSDTSDVVVPDACADLVRQVGAVAKFGGLDATALAKCNRVARH